MAKKSKKSKKNKKNRSKKMSIQMTSNNNLLTSSALVSDDDLITKSSCFSEMSYMEREELFNDINKELSKKCCDWFDIFAKFNISVNDLKCIFGDKHKRRLNNVIKMIGKIPTQSEVDNHIAELNNESIHENNFVNAENVEKNFENYDEENIERNFESSLNDDEDDSYEDDSYEDDSYEDDSYEDDSYEDDSYFRSFIPDKANTSSSNLNGSSDKVISCGELKSNFKYIVVDTSAVSKMDFPKMFIYEYMNFPNTIFVFLSCVCDELQNVFKNTHDYLDKKMLDLINEDALQNRGRILIKDVSNILNTHLVDNKVVDYAYLVAPYSEVWTGDKLIISKCVNKHIVCKFFLDKRHNLNTIFNNSEIPTPIIDDTVYDDYVRDGVRGEVSDTVSDMLKVPEDSKSDELDCEEGEYYIPGTGRLFKRTLTTLYNLKFGSCLDTYKSYKRSQFVISGNKLLSNDVISLKKGDYVIIIKAILDRMTTSLSMTVFRVINNNDSDNVLKVYCKKFTTEESILELEDSLFKKALLEMLELMSVAE